MQAQLVVQGDGIDGGIHIRRFQQGLAVGRKPERRGTAAVIERLDAQAVAREKQATLAAVPKRESEHADQTFDAALAPFGISLQDDFGIAVGKKPVTLCQ